MSKKAAHYIILKYGTQMFHGTFVQPIQRRRRGLWTSLALLKWVAAIDINIYPLSSTVSNIMIIL